MRGTFVHRRSGLLMVLKLREVKHRQKVQEIDDEVSARLILRQRCRCVTRWQTEHSLVEQCRVW